MGWNELRLDAANSENCENYFNGHKCLNNLFFGLNLSFLQKMSTLNLSLRMKSWRCFIPVRTTKNYSTRTPAEVLALKWNLKLKWRPKFLGSVQLISRKGAITPKKWDIFPSRLEKWSPPLSDQFQKCLNLRTYCWRKTPQTDILKGRLSKP